VTAFVAASFVDRRFWTARELILGRVFLGRVFCMKATHL